MKDKEQIEIQLSKSKLTLLFVGSIMFVGLGVWYVASPPKVNISVFSSPTIILIVGLASIVFFGLAGLFIFKKLSDNSPGLIISAEGVFDNSSGVSAGFVPWTDIVEIKETKVFNQTFINLVVKNPQDYIDRQKSAVKRKAVQINYTSYGTVIGISANGLKIKYNELAAILLPILLLVWVAKSGDSLWFTILLFTYIPYRILIDGWRLVDKKRMKWNEICKLLIPFTRYKFFKSLYFSY